MSAPQDRIVAAIRGFNATNGDLIQSLTILRVAMTNGNASDREWALNDTSRVLTRQTELILALEAMLSEIGGAR